MFRTIRTKPLWVAGRGGVQQVYLTLVVMIDCLKQHSIPPLAASPPITSRPLQALQSLMACPPYTGRHRRPYLKRRERSTHRELRQREVGTMERGERVPSAEKRKYSQFKCSTAGRLQINHIPYQVHLKLYTVRDVGSLCGNV